MIARFWNALFDYADKAKEEGNQLKVDIVHEIEGLLQMAYDGGMDHKSLVTDWHPKDRVGKLVASIPDIEVYRDPHDKKLFWELDGRYFDYPEEVLTYLINFRTDKAIKQMSDYKALFLEAVKESIEEFRLSHIFSGDSRKIKDKNRKETE